MTRYCRTAAVTKPPRLILMVALTLSAALDHRFVPDVYGTPQHGLEYSRCAIEAATKFCQWVVSSVKDHWPIIRFAACRMSLAACRLWTAGTATLTGPQQVNFPFNALLSLRSFCVCAVKIIKIAHV
jgi:hypothetical protein